MDITNLNDIAQEMLELTGALEAEYDRYAEARSNYEYFFETRGGVKKKFGIDSREYAEHIGFMVDYKKDYLQSRGKIDFMARKFDALRSIFSMGKSQLEIR